MSSHPNTILLLALTPDNLTRKTYRNICNESGIDCDDDYLVIGDNSYQVLIMESDYDNNYQIQAREGDIVVFDHVTYGYGRVVSWEDLEKQKKSLEDWAIGICERHNCTYKIFVTANYW